MTVKIRLARFGCKHSPFYRLIVTDSKFRRDGRHLEFVGFYDPLSGKDGGPKRTGLNVERIRYWLSVGAQPSEPVERILIKAGLLPKDVPNDVEPADDASGSVLNLALPVDVAENVDT